MLDDHSRHMEAALELARKGIGCVEPNPMVGCVIVYNERVVASGYHERFGFAHAEVNAILNAQQTNQSIAGATAYVTLEPCCHLGKTPPCVDALIDAQIRHVVIATLDPSEKVAGKGVERLKEAGIKVTVGVCESSAKELIAPFSKLHTVGKPWVLGKWAMTLDGKIATHSGSSKWISNDACRQVAHQIRGRVDAIMIGRQTADADDPMLDARPSGARVATRIIFDSKASLSLNSKLVQTAQTIPVIIVTGPDAHKARIIQLQEAGCEILQFDTSKDQRILATLEELGRRQFTNVLVEGGSELLGAFFDQRQIDEAHIFIGNKIVGGQTMTAVSGKGVADMATASMLPSPKTEILDGNVYISGRVHF